ARDARVELGVVEEGARPRVAQQVEQLLVDVAVIDVQRSGARLVAAEHPLEVLVAVVEVDREVVLAGLVAGELAALAMRAEPARAEKIREAPAPLLHLAMRQTP